MSRSRRRLGDKQHLESVGRLAAAIAHEINTPLQFVGDNLHFLRDAVARVSALDGVELTPELVFLRAEVPGAIEQSLAGLQRVAAIVRELREFAQPSDELHAGADVNDSLRSALSVATNQLGVVADVETEFADLPPVQGYVADLNQVFLHLLVNTAQAIADRDDAQRGKIRLCTRLDGNDVVVQVSETHIGIGAFFTLRLPVRDSSLPAKVA